MNELKKRLTKFFYEATRVKSYIDFSGENYQKAKDSELSSGRINSLATNEFWVENKPSDTKKDKLEVILIPKVLADGLIDLGVDVRVPFGILYVPARLDKDGTLFPPDSIYKTPWIPRDVLTPFHMQEKAIGAWSEYPQKHFLKENFQNWDNYWEAVRSFYEKALCVSWGETEIENKKSEKGELLALDEESYFILDQTVDAKFHIRSLYKKILAGKNLSLSLYDKMLTGEQETQEAPYQAHSLRCMYQHSGQMGGEYPLSESQREAVNHFHFLKDGDVLAVSGPPGTGKTTLLQSIVADMLVSHALVEDPPPVIVATSTNNQAVTNVIDSFAKIPNIGLDDLLEQRWIEGVNSLAAYFPSTQAMDKNKDKSYFCTTEVGGFSFAELENEQNEQKALGFFLEKASDYFHRTFKKWDEVAAALHEKLEHCVQSKKQILDSLNEVQKIMGNDSYREFIEKTNQLKEQLRIESMSVASKLKAAEEKLDTCCHRYADWQNYYDSTPWYLVFFSRFFRIFREEMEKRLRMHMNREEESCWNEDICWDTIQTYYLREKRKYDSDCIALKGELTGLEEKVTHHNSVLELLEKKVKGFHNCLNALKQEIDIYFVPTPKDIPLEEAERKIEKQRLWKEKQVSEMNVEGINSLLDTTLRYLSFWFAIHYYEARWFSSDYRLTDKQKPRRYANVQQKRFHRMAMLTPCMVMTFFRLPGVFATGEPNKEEKSFLFNYIDLLIVDEAGQVSPEVALPSFGLAKKALVVGDEEQIPPVWEIKTDMDVTLATLNNVISNASEYELLQENGMNCAESSIMRIAAMACRFRKDGSRGLFLSEHRRCYDEIIDYCNKLVYQGKLKPCRGSIRHDDKNTLKSEFPAMGHFPIEVESSEKRGSSRFNKEEAQQIVQWIATHADKIQSTYPKEGGIENLIGVITPFKAQAAVIKKALPKHLKKIRVGTIHTFQGAECRIIIISTVYGGEDGCFFIENNKSLMNVAVSRAKDFFFVFGNRKCLLHTESSTTGLLRQMTEESIAGK